MLYEYDYDKFLKQNINNFNIKFNSKPTTILNYVFKKRYIYIY